MACKTFSQRLRKWLNVRGYVAGDWPDNVSDRLKRDADMDVGRGYMLNRCGFKTKRRARG